MNNQTSTPPPIPPIPKKKEDDDIEDFGSDFLIPLKVFICDFEPPQISLIKSVMEKNLFRVETFTKSPDLLNRLSFVVPDIVICEYHMPEVGQLELLKKIRKSRKDVPVIFISGSITKDELLRCLHHGLFAYLDKPLNLKLLMNTCVSGYKTQMTMKLLGRCVDFIDAQMEEFQKYLIAAGEEKFFEALKFEYEKIREHKTILESID